MQKSSATGSETIVVQPQNNADIALLAAIAIAAHQAPTTAENLGEPPTFAEPTNQTTDTQLQASESDETVEEANTSSEPITNVEQEDRSLGQSPSIQSPTDSASSFYGQLPVTTQARRVLAIQPKSPEPTPEKPKTRLRKAQGPKANKKQRVRR